jgi:predicted patatin/cPLA2 family phospholipase
MNLTTTSSTEQFVNYYKIITRHDKNNKNIFLIYKSDEPDIEQEDGTPRSDTLILNSQSLMKLSMVREFSHDILQKLLNYNNISTINASHVNISTVLDKDKSTIITTTTTTSTMTTTPSTVITLQSLEVFLVKFTNTLSTFYENMIMFKFDPYCNFLLNDNNYKQDIKYLIEIIQNTHPSDNIMQKDFSNLVNPYGLEKIVFTGGGTKGIMYIGAFLGLLATGQIFYLNHFSGTSVGALSSMILGCVTPRAEDYDIIKTMSLRDLITQKVAIVDKYRMAAGFIMEKFYKRDIDTFYSAPNYTFYGMWTAIDTIIKNNGLYDPQKSGFLVWYALICKKVCSIMENGLDNLIIIKKKDGTIVNFLNEKIEKCENELNKYDNVNIDTDSFEGWEIIKFFTFQEYNDFTHKKIVLTGTQTKRIETVYYTHSNSLYKDLSVIIAASASMSIPWIFKAPIINDSYNLDGGIYDNYPLTHCDKKVKDKVTHYNNKIFGYLIDDNSTMIDTYEIIRELWLVYMGFIDVMNISYLTDSSDILNHSIVDPMESLNYVKISELFFEIRSEIYKLLYFVDTDLETFLSRDDELITAFNIRDLEDIYTKLLDNCTAQSPENCNQCNGLLLPVKGIEFIENYLKELTTINKDHSILIETFKIGKKTNLADVCDISIKQGNIYNILTQLINEELDRIDLIMKNKICDTFNRIIIRYDNVLRHLMGNILAYYEHKGTFVKGNDLVSPSKYFSEIMKNLYKKLLEFDTITNNATIFVNKKRKEKFIKNYMTCSVQIAITMISKILTRGSGNNIDMTNFEIKKEQSSYQKVLDYFFHTDMTGILYKYMSIANDRICNDSFNDMRTIKLNSFETSTLHFNMDDDLKARLMGEGYFKTIRYFTSLLHTMEVTGKLRSSDEYIESIEIVYKKML